MIDDQYIQSMPDAKIVGDYMIYIKKSLGKGKFGEVFEALNTTNNMKVAAKVTINNNNLDQQGINKILEDKEMMVLKKLKHENLIHMYDFRITRNNIYMFLEYCKDGDLHNYMKAQKNQFTDIQILELLKQLCNGFQYLYDNKIMHRDLKPENIMMHNGVLKIADFGFARMIEGDPNQACNFTLRGTPLYLPPQIFDGGKYSTKFDVWSMGAILHELLFNGKHYMSGVKTLDQLKNKIMNCKGKQPILPHSHRHHKLIDLIAQMLQYHEEDRISWQQIFEHDFFTQSALKFLGQEEEPQQNDLSEVSIASEHNEQQQSLLKMALYFSRKLQISGFFKKFLRCLDERDISSQLSSFKRLLIKNWFLLQYYKQVVLINKQVKYELPIQNLENEQKEYSKSKQSQVLRDYISNLEKQLVVQQDFISELIGQQKKIYFSLLDGITRDTKYYEEFQQLKDILKTNQDTDHTQLLNLIQDTQQLKILRVGIQVTNMLSKSPENFYIKIDRIVAAQDANELLLILA